MANETNTSLRSRIRAMEKGDQITVSLDDYAVTTVRSYASDLAFFDGRRYITRRDRGNRATIIIRVS